MACREELPFVQRAHQKLKGRGLEVIGVSLDPELLGAQQLEGELGLGFPSLHEGALAGSRIAADFAVVALPASFLIDGQGRLVAMDIEPERIEAVAAELLARDAPAPAPAAERED